MKKKSNAIVIIFLIIAAAAGGAFGYKMLNKPDERKAGDKLQDAMLELQKGMDNAAKQLGERTQGDEIKDATSNLLNSIAKPDKE